MNYYHQLLTSIAAIEPVKIKFFEKNSSYFGACNEVIDLPNAFLNYHK